MSATAVRWMTFLNQDGELLNKIPYSPAFLGPAGKAIKDTYEYFGSILQYSAILLQRNVLKT